MNFDFALKYIKYEYILAHNLVRRSQLNTYLLID